MWKLDSEEIWVPKNWCFWTVVLEKILESPLDCKEIQSVHSEGDQSWDFFGRNDAEAETPVLWPPYAKSWLIGKDPDAGRDWGQEEAQAGIKIAGRNINNLRYTDDTILVAEIEEELKSLLIKAKEESEKAGLKLNIQKTKIMVSGPTTSWHIDGETVETVLTFFFWAPKSLQMVTVAIKLKDACSLEEKLWQT